MINWNSIVSFIVDKFIIVRIVQYVPFPWTHCSGRFSELILVSVERACWCRSVVRDGMCCHCFSQICSLFFVFGDEVLSTFPLSVILHSRLQTELLSSCSGPVVCMAHLWVFSDPIVRGLAIRRSSAQNFTKPESKLLHAGVNYSICMWFLLFFLNVNVKRLELGSGVKCLWLFLLRNLHLLIIILYIVQVVTSLALSTPTALSKCSCLHYFDAAAVWLSAVGSESSMAVNESSDAEAVECQASPPSSLPVIRQTGASSAIDDVTAYIDAATMATTPVVHGDLVVDMSQDEVQVAMNWTLVELVSHRTCIT